MIKPTDPFQLMNQFTSAVSVDMDREKAATLLSQEVEFVVTTDTSKKSIVGIDKVINFFEKYIWSNTSRVSILSYKVKKAETMTPETKMTVLEIKTRGEEWGWFKFNLKTKYELTIEDNALVISRMETVQEQLYTPDRPFTPWKSFPSEKS